MGALSSSSSLILPHIFRRPPPPPLSLLRYPHLKLFHKTSSSLGPPATKFIYSPSFSRHLSLSSSSFPSPHSLSLLRASQDNVDAETETGHQDFDNPEKESDVEAETETVHHDFENPERESDVETEREMGHQDFDDPEKDSGVHAKATDGSRPVVVVDAKLSSKHREMLVKLGGISIKEKKELASYAHSLGKKLKSQQIGKSGITDAVGIALLQTLEANELLKIKIHSNCPQELDDAVKQLEEATGSVVVSRTGRTVIIYRPSLTKLIAEEKKKLNQKILLKRRAAFNSSFQNRGRPPKPYVRNRGRGSSVSEGAESAPSSRGRRGMSRV